VSSLEVFETFGYAAWTALRAREIPRVRAADYFTPDDASDAAAIAELAQWDEYLSQFAKLTSAKCLCCGNQLSCPLGMGLFGGFEWGLAHGEGHCAHCRYPMRGHHRVEGLGTIRNLFLAYHPSLLLYAPEEPKEADVARALR
jgi:hypothetical protein